MILTHEIDSTAQTIAALESQLVDAREKLENYQRLQEKAGNFIETAMQLKDSISSADDLDIIAAELSKIFPLHKISEEKQTSICNACHDNTVITKSDEPQAAEQLEDKVESKEPPNLRFELINAFTGALTLPDYNNKTVALYAGFTAKVEANKFYRQMVKNLELSRSLDYTVSEPRSSTRMTDYKWEVKLTGADGIQYDHVQKFAQDRFEFGKPDVPVASPKLPAVENPDAELDTTTSSDDYHYQPGDAVRVTSTRILEATGKICKVTAHVLTTGSLYLDVPQKGGGTQNWRFEAHEVELIQSADALASTGKVDFSDVIAKTNVELRRLGWGNAEGRQYLLDTYSKRSRQLLSDEELLDFLVRLQAMPTPSAEEKLIAV